jgi:flavodoxin
MSTTLVTYFSRSGNTKSVAQAIFDALIGAKEIRPLNEAGSLEGYGLFLVGFPVHQHSVPFPVEAFLKTIPAGKPLALFSTHGSMQSHQLSREAIEYAVVLASRAKLLGAFTCRGRLSVQALEVLGRSPEHQEWTEMAASAATHPDAVDLEEARAFARRMEMLAAHGGY